MTEQTNEQENIYVAVAENEQQQETIQNCCGTDCCKNEKKCCGKGHKKCKVLCLVIFVLLATVSGGVAGYLAMKSFFPSYMPKTAENGMIQEQVVENGEAMPQRNGELTASAEVLQKEENTIVSVVEKASPAVVSIIVTKDLPKIQQYQFSPFGNDFFQDFLGDDLFNQFFQMQQQSQQQGGTEKQEIGGGTGFLISQDGYVVTNKHVVIDEDAEYTVLLNDESKHSAKVLARDSVNDVAILKIEIDNAPTLALGDSKDLKAGQTVIAIGNALGEFRNTVSTGVISGLSRSVVAGGPGIGSEELVGVIQTDASINPGNSGGPLLNIYGKVIGINTAIVQGAQNIGFAIPINEVKGAIDSVREHGRIVRPWLGVRYVIINDEIKKANSLDVDYGALIVRGEARTDLAVIPGSPADKAGLVENDIILEINGEKITVQNALIKIVNTYKPGDKVTLKVLHKGAETEMKVALEERK